MHRTPMDFFRAISQIPRISGNEAAVADFVENLAREKGYSVRRDGMHNLVVVRPASAGMEHAPTVMIQGHMDMVAAQKDGVVHDFEKDGIQLIVNGDILTAAGTTLGADDGVAVSYMLAILDDETILAPRLECVFTVQEETGLIGAQALDMTGLEAKRMINLDAGPEGSLLVTCAGGCRAKLRRKAQMVAQDAPRYRVAVSGLRGGSGAAGMERQQANGLVVLAMVCQKLLAAGGRLASLHGGQREGFLPESAEAVVAFAGDVGAVLEPLATQIAKTWIITDPDVRLTWEAADDGPVLDESTQRAVVDALRLLPQGILGMSTVFPNLVETSSTLGVCHADWDGVEIGLSMRSASDLKKEMLQQQTSVVAGCFGYDMELSAQYPGWNYEPESPLREAAKHVFQTQYGREPQVGGVHAGFECGVFKAAMPWLDIIAMGPTYQLMHTADEWLDLPSFSRTFTFLTALLQTLGQTNAAV